MTRLRYNGERRLQICSDVTDNEWLELTEKIFNDKEKRNRCKLMLSKIPKLTPDEFEVYLVIEFAKMGYELKTKYVSADE